MDDKLICVTGTRNPSGWRLDVEINEIVQNVCTSEEQALLLEKLACVASKPRFAHPASSSVPVSRTTDLPLECLDAPLEGAEAIVESLSHVLETARDFRVKPLTRGNRVLDPRQASADLLRNSGWSPWWPPVSVTKETIREACLETTRKAEQTESVPSSGCRSGIAGRTQTL